MRCRCFGRACPVPRSIDASVSSPLDSDPSSGVCAGVCAATLRLRWVVLRAVRLELGMAMLGLAAGARRLRHSAQC